MRTLTIQTALFFAALLLFAGPALAKKTADMTMRASVMCDNKLQTKKNCLKKRKKHYSNARKRAKKKCKQKSGGWKFKGGSLKRHKSTCVSYGAYDTRMVRCDFSFKCKKK